MLWKKDHMSGDVPAFPHANVTQSHQMVKKTGASGTDAPVGHTVLKYPINELIEQVFTVALFIFLPASTRTGVIPPHFNIHPNRLGFTAPLIPRGSLRRLCRLLATGSQAHIGRIIVD